jgi:hypothetical protein
MRHRSEFREKLSFIYFDINDKFLLVEEKWFIHRRVEKIMTGKLQQETAENSEYYNKNTILCQTYLQFKILTSLIIAQSIKSTSEQGSIFTI